MPALLDEAPCGFVSLTEKGHVVLVNSTLARMLDHDSRELIGVHVEKLFTTPTKIFFQTHVFPMLRMQPTITEVYLTLRKRDGESVHTLANAAKRERHGESLVDLVLMPILEREKYEQELLRGKRQAEEANRAKVEFLSHMSHDLRTPLNAVSGYAELLLMGVRGALNAEQTRDVERIKNAGAFLLGLINDVLAFARLELGKAELHIKPVKLESILVLTVTRPPDGVNLLALASRLSRICCSRSGSADTISSSATGARR